jgi:hypothetical protein
VSVRVLDDFLFDENNFISSALTHIDQSESTLSQFWSIHKTRLNYCLALRHFEQHFKEIQCVFIQLYNEFTHLPDVNISLLSSDYCRSDNNKEEIAQTLIQLDDLSQRTQVIISIDVIVAYISYIYTYLDDDQSCYSVGK